MNPYHALANAIVIQTAKDYRKARKMLAKNPRNGAARYVKNDCEKFFRSSWCELLTSVDGEMILEQLQKEAVV